MKRFFLLLILSVSVMSYAETKTSFKSHLTEKLDLKGKSLRQKTTILPLDIKTFKSVAPERKAINKVPEVNAGSFKPTVMPGFQKVPQNVESETKERLDSVVYTNPTGTNINKMTFVFTEKQWSHREIHSNWNSVAGIWEPVEEFIFDWDNDGYLSTYTILNYEWNEGIKETYTYNEQGLGDSRIVSFFDGNTWEPMEKYLYGYDNNGNTNELHIFVYEGSWVEIERQSAVYNAYNQQTNWEGYYWDGAQWIGTGKEETVYYSLTDNSRVTNYQSYIWNEQTEVWENDFKMEQDFDNGYITRQEYFFWNGIDWSGSIDLVNDKTVFTYDAQWRETSQMYSKYIGGVWTQQYALNTEWSVEVGETQSVRKGYNYETITEGDFDWETITRYSSYYPILEAIATEKFTYRIDKQKIESDWVTAFEEEWIYDNSGNMLRETFWRFDGDTKLADIDMQNTYDNNGNCTEIMIYIGQETGENDWILNGKTVYEYINDVAVRMYSYSGEQLEPESGSGVDYNFDVPASDIIVFIGYTNPYKTFYLYDYEGNGSGFDIYKRTFYYSEQEVSAVKEVANDNRISIYPNPATDVLCIDVSEPVQITIYDMNGVKLLQTYEKQINISALSSGFYIVDVNGTKTKVIKK